MEKQTPEADKKRPGRLSGTLKRASRAVVKFWGGEPIDPPASKIDIVQKGIERSREQTASFDTPVGQLARTVDSFLDEQVENKSKSSNIFYTPDGGYAHQTLTLYSGERGDAYLRPGVRNIEGRPMAKSPLLDNADLVELIVSRKTGYEHGLGYDRFTIDAVSLEKKPPERSYPLASRVEHRIELFQGSDGQWAYDSQIIPREEVSGFRYAGVSVELPEEKVSALVDIISAAQMESQFPDRGGQ